MKIGGALSGGGMFGKSIADDKQNTLNYLLELNGRRPLVHD
jgi:hypothetical protein